MSSWVKDTVKNRRKNKNKYEKRSKGGDKKKKKKKRTETYVSEGQSSKLNPSLLCRTITPMCFSDEGGKVFLDNDEGNAHEDLFFGEFDSDSQSWKLFESKLNGEEKGLLPMQHEYLIILYYCPKMLFFYFLL